MKARRIIPALLFATAVLVVSSFSYADVKIKLKNGRVVTAEVCDDQGERLMCSRWGGVFEIGKEEIDKVTEAPAGAEDEAAGRPAEPVPAAPTAGEDKSATPQPSPEKELDRITARKKELMQDRDALLKERRQLQEDAGKAPDWMPDKQFDELQKKSSDIDRKVNGFNEEVNKLNREEEKVLEQMKNKKE